MLCDENVRYYTDSHIQLSMCLWFLSKSSTLILILLSWNTDSLGTGTFLVDLLFCMVYCFLNLFF